MTHPNEPRRLGPADAEAETGIAPTEPGAAIEDTEAVTAWSLDDGEEWQPKRWLTPARITVAAISASVLVIGLSAAVAVHYTRDDPPAAAAVAGPPPSGRPPTPKDRDFMARLRERGVPADDWRYYVDWAKLLCRTWQQSGIPPGVQATKWVEQEVREKEPTWSTAQVFQFTANTLSWYCPDIFGPTEEELAAMPPEDRLVFLLGSHVGLKVDDPASVAAMARGVCAELAAGNVVGAVIDGVQAANESHHGWSRDTSTGVVFASIEAYCPEFRGGG
ncbi:hypothetical protein QEH38_gp42 [Mycobacterium phage LilSpotty]|uniref:DUF732 domain-containing protein n=1 Tax=Mycobacterium phage LilSpotty TaxID=2588512 RepID=A0A4Y6EWH2_9CAUD|nr:hypothetical protein QEH38_gp42 [Mycobacterium phage LilSpotty]QDF19774.1 hypothetical protein SEA_LILSPOTTY_42 [Mycobacterium phage LilSpotty]